MLRELLNTRQIKGELPRKWYFSEELDLVVWFNPAEIPCAFQLAYDKNSYEKSISWHFEKGYRHYVVNNSRWFATPLLNEGGLFKKDKVLKQFLALSSELPLPVAELVSSRLQEFNGPIYANKPTGIGAESVALPMLFESDDCSNRYDLDGNSLVTRRLFSSNTQVTRQKPINPPCRRQQNRRRKLSYDVIFMLIFAVATTIFTVLYS